MKSNNRSTIGKLLSYIRPYRLLFVISILLTVVTVMANMIIPIMYGKGLDLITGPGNVDFNALIHVILLMAIIILSGMMSQLITGYINNRITYRIVNDMRKQTFEKLQQLPLSFLDSKASGELLSRCITDIEQISDGLLMGFTQVFNGLLTILFTIVFMVRINPFITIAVVALSPLTFLLTKFIASRTRNMFMLQSSTRGELLGFTNEMLENSKLVYAFNHKKEARRTFDEKNERLSSHTLKALFFSSLVNPSTRLIYSMLYVIVTIFGGLSVLKGAMTVGSLTAMLGYTNQYSKPFNEISGVVAEFQNAIASAARVFEILEADSKELIGNDLADRNSVQGDVAFNNVSFSYDKDADLIKDFNLKINAGQRVAIVGPTGCGKTTLINLLMRFYDVDSGKICIDGADINEMPYEKLRSHYGMVLQDIWLKSGTVLENIAYGKPGASRDEIISAAKNAYAHDFITKLPDGYETYITEDGTSLSQGQKQLLCIARVMLTDPPMLILDEATSSVDSMTEIRITNAFDKLMQGRTSFIVAHRLSTIQNADIILVMNNGKIIEQGTHEELLSRQGFYFDLYNSQFAV